jgi:hypothetical protein
VVNISGTYEESKLDWIMHQFDVRVYNSDGDLVSNEDNWGIVKE